jgi:DNA-directed RNA polymerase specialized sigma24 family protein
VDGAHFFSLCGVILSQSFLRERRRVARGQGRGLAGSESTDDSVTPGPLEPAQTTDDPLKLASWTEFHGHVAQLRRRYSAGDRTRGLSEEEFTAFTLRRFEGTHPREIATLLNVSVRTVSNFEARAVRKLHGHLKDWWRS